MSRRLPEPSGTSTATPGAPALFRRAARLDWPRLALGLWLLAAAAAGAWTGPVTNLAVCALAGGGGILLMAAIEPRLRRS